MNSKKLDERAACSLSWSDLILSMSCGPADSLKKYAQEKELFLHIAISCNAPRCTSLVVSRVDLFVKGVEQRIWAGLGKSPVAFRDEFDDEGSENMHILCRTIGLTGFLCSLLQMSNRSLFSVSRYPSAQVLIRLASVLWF